MNNRLKKVRFSLYANANNCVADFPQSSCCILTDGTVQFSDISSKYKMGQRVYFGLKLWPASAVIVDIIESWSLEFSLLDTREQCKCIVKYKLNTGQFINESEIIYGEL